ncbi:MAG: pseudoazurin [Pseudomonadota bacterium]
MSSKELKFTLAATVCAFALVACGGGSEPPAPAADTETTDVAAAAEGAAAAAEEASEAAETAASEAADTVEVAAEEVTEAAEDVVEGTEDAAAAAGESLEAAAEDAGAAVTEAAAPAEPAEEAGEEAPAEEAAAATDGDGPKTIEIQMLNVNPDNRRERQVFLPKVTEVNVGDTVTWVPTDLSHQSASIDGMIPEGAAEWNSQINKPISYTFEKPGVYGYQCVPHYAAGMVGLVVVKGEGKLDNLEAAKSVRQPGLAGRVFPQLFEEAEAAGYLN